MSDEVLISLRPNLPLQIESHSISNQSRLSVYESEVSVTVPRGLERERGRYRFVPDCTSAARLYLP
jgi:hypothetical protein